MAEDTPTNNEQEERFAALEAEVAKLRSFADAVEKHEQTIPVDSPIPFYRVRGDQYIKPFRSGPNLVLRFNESTLQQRFPGVLDGGGGGIIAQCPSTWVTTKMRCFARPGQKMLWIETQVNLDTNICAQRVNAFEDCCVTCPDGSSGDAYTDLDEWIDCDEDGTLIYLPKQVYDSLTIVDPKIQLEGAGLCYKLSNRNETNTPTAWAQILVYSGCDNEACETPAPCTWASPPASLTLSNPGSVFGSVIRNFNGSTCDSATNSGQPESANIVADQYQENPGVSQALLATALTYVQTESGIVAQIQSFSIGLDVANCRWYIRVLIDVGSSKQIIWLKGFGDTPSGTYTLAPFGTGTWDTSSTLESCSTLAQTLTLP